MKISKLSLIVVGIVYIIGQLVAFIGMSRMYVGLYPSSDNLMEPIYCEESGLNAGTLLFAVTAGIDRFDSSFKDLTFPKDKYRVPTAEQYASAMIRESLGCSRDGSFGLVVYDIVLAISYSLLGIAGAILLFFGTRPSKK